MKSSLEQDNLDQGNSEVPGKSAYYAGLLLALALLVACIYIPFDSFRQLALALQNQHVLIRFDAHHFFFFGGFIAAGALLLLCLYPLLGKSASSRTHININIAFIVALFVGVVARLLGSVCLDIYLQQQGYHACAKQSSSELRQRQHAWVIDEVLCESTLSLDNVTLAQLKELLKK